MPQWLLLFGLFIHLISIPMSVHAWGLHYLITDRALAHPSVQLAPEPLRVEPMEEFLRDQAESLGRLFDEYYAWLAVRGSKRFRPMSFPADRPTREAFLAAARLNPSTNFFLIRRGLPGIRLDGPAIAFQTIAPKERIDRAFIAQFEDTTNTTMSARAILSTFADEPDWEMDQDLWQFTEYGYGALPYGAPTGTASKAPFHMLFQHENWVVRIFAPEILEGMAIERIELWRRLAQLAFRAGHPYWGYRFTAWAIHYIQDLSQPYHAKAVPHATRWYYVKFIFSWNKAAIKAATTQLVKNRHFAYEDFVAYGLQQSYLEDHPLFRRMADFLTEGTSTIQHTDTVEELVAHVTAFSAAHASGIDATIVAAYGSKITNDPSYDLRSDPQYEVRTLSRALPVDLTAKLVEETGEDFRMAGRATRTLLDLIQQ